MTSGVVLRILPVFIINFVEQVYQQKHVPLGNILKAHLNLGLHLAWEQTTTHSLAVGDCGLFHSVGCFVSMLMTVFWVFNLPWLIEVKLGGNTPCQNSLWTSTIHEIVWQNSPACAISQACLCQLAQTAPLSPSRLQARTKCHLSRTRQGGLSHLC